MKKNKTLDTPIPLKIEKFTDYPIKNLRGFRKIEFGTPDFLEGDTSNIYFEVYNNLNQKIETVHTYPKKESHRNPNLPPVPPNPKMPGLEPNSIDLNGETEVTLRVCSDGNKEKNIHIIFYYSVVK